MMQSMIHNVQSNQTENQALKLLPYAVAALAACAAIIPAFSGIAMGQRGFLAAVIFLFLATLIQMDARIGLSATLLYLATMGWLRRFLIPYFDWVDMDPLLLVGPGIAVVFGGGAILRTRGKSVSKQTRLVLALLVYMALEIVNPLQGGIQVGVIGAIFYMVPLLWFFVGREFVDARVLSSFLRTMVWISTVAVAYGLYQTWFGFSASEEQWIKLTNSYWLYYGDGQRAFSTFPSPAEYAHFLSTSTIILIAGLLCRKRLGLVIIPFLLLGIFFASARGVVIFLLMTACILWAVMAKERRSWMIRGGIAFVVAVFSLTMFMTRVQESNYSGAGSGLVKHQTDGLLNPTDSSKSTAGLHAQMLTTGLLRGFTTPIGVGLGATTLAGKKLGTDASNAEIDVANIFISLGFLGGFLYIAFVALSLGIAIKTWHRTRHLVWLSVVGILTVCFGAWLIGGEYTTSTVVWLCLGALARAQRKDVAA